MRSRIDNGNIRSDTRRRQVVSAVNRWFWGGGGELPTVPLSQSDLFAWYKASMIDQTDSIYEYESSVVKGLDDLSGHRRDMYINTAGYRPSISTVSGKQVVALSGSGGTTGDRFCAPFRPRQLFNLATGFEMIFSFTLPDGRPATNDRRFFQHDGTLPTGDFFSLTLSTGGVLTLRMTQGTVTVNAVSSPAVYSDGDNGQQYLCVRVDLVTEQVTMYRANDVDDWTQITLSGSAGSNGNFASLNMANYGENYFNTVFFARQVTSDNFTLQANFKELIISAKTLTNTERDDILTYLKLDPQTVTRYSPTGSVNTPAATNKLRIILGQSQYDGREPLAPLIATYPYLDDPITRSYTFDWKLSNIFAPLEAGVNGCNADTKLVGPIFPLAQRLQTDNPGNTYFFYQGSEGGTALDLWSSGGANYNRSLFDVRNVINSLYNSSAGVNIETLIWSQGESDCQVGDEADSLSYQGREATLLNIYPTIYEYDHLTSVNLHDGYIIANFPYFQNIIDAKDDNVALVDTLISTLGYALMADDLHYNQASNVLIADATH